LVFAFLLVPAVASADAHRAGLFGGGSYLRASSLGGFEISGDVVLCELPTTSKLKFFSVVGDFGLYKGTHDDVDVTIKTFMGGGALRFARNEPSPHVGSVHVLVGGAKATGGDTEFAAAVGGAYDYIIHRGEPKQYGFRVQVDGILPKEGDKFLRVSGGVVVRFRK
jgi:hypothetical protein